MRPQAPSPQPYLAGELEVFAEDFQDRAIGVGLKRDGFVVDGEFKFGGVGHALLQRKRLNHEVTNSTKRFLNRRALSAWVAALKMSSSKYGSLFILLLIPGFF